MPSVPTITSTSPSRPAAATAPRPPGPSVPGRVRLVDDEPRTVDARPARRSRRAARCRRPSRTRSRSRSAASRGSPCRRMHPVEVLDVAVAVDDDLRTREAAAVDDRGVVELVGEDHALRGRPGRRARRCWRGSPSRTARTTRCPRSRRGAPRGAGGSSSSRHQPRRARRRRPSASPPRRRPRARADDRRGRGSCSSTAAAPACRRAARSAPAGRDTMRRRRLERPRSLQSRPRRSAISLIAVSAARTRRPTPRSRRALAAPPGPRARGSAALGA